LGGLAGCGGSASQQITQVATIESFGASPATITAGGSSSLTGIFSNGTGVITPGNLAVTSGTAVSVSPAATATYTLTVTGTSGAAATQTLVVTVIPAPAITSFTANPATITAGQSANLTGVFANGTGIITPGNLGAASGTAVSVSPTATTTYTLTVTNSVGTAVTLTATVTVVPAPTITSFTANPPTIAAGGSSSLTAVFTGGSGVITPGNLPAVSGTPVSVSPAATTVYTLTVTNSNMTSVTQTVTVTVSAAPPSIISFTANPATIASGQSSSLTADFTGGTGEIIPGNIPVTSGTPVSVSPTATTIYTLTVTPASGAAVTQTVTVTVTGPVITSFVASPAAITSGKSSSLTAVFTGGTGEIAPGNIPVTSGTPVSVTPTQTTTYILTVTPATGTAVTQMVTVGVGNAVIAVDQSSLGPAVTDQLLGMNLAAWYDVTNSTNGPAIKNAFQAAGIKAIRWPGGSWSDAYNWETNKECGNYANGDDDFTDVVNKLVIPASLDLALTADYGTGKNCTGPGDPTEAAAWAAESSTLGVPVSYMTVGNEEYGSWETDLHAKKNDATTYATAVAGASGYYQLIKAASPNTLVGVDVNPGNNPSWDPIVLKNAPYDFVEYHYYPEAPGQESDSFLVNQGAQGLTNYINTIKSELKTAGKPDTPIYVGEIGGPYSNPGKQSWSITQGLYAGQVLGEMMNEGVVRLTWWIGFGNCNGSGGNDSASLYGWQNFGAYNVFSDGPSDSNCPGAGPIGTMSPTARAFQLFSNVAVTGENVLTAGVTGDTADVHAYAATNSGGTALVLFNRNETNSVPVVVTLSAQTTANTVSVITYDKAIYDLSGSPTGNPKDPNGTNTWAGPTTTTPAAALPLTLTLTPWSMTVVLIH
jgi:hypothetical protein